MGGSRLGSGAPQRDARVVTMMATTRAGWLDTPPSVHVLLSRAALAQPAEMPSMAGVIDSRSESEIGALPASATAACWPSSEAM